jgi:hypothetical protein
VWSILADVAASTWLAIANDHVEHLIVHEAHVPFGYLVVFAIRARFA